MPKKLQRKYSKKVSRLNARLKTCEAGSICLNVLLPIKEESLTSIGKPRHVHNFGFDSSISEQSVSNFIIFLYILSFQP